jgi:hypothetical protein
LGNREKTLKTVAVVMVVLMAGACGRGATKSDSTTPSQVLPTTTMAPTTSATVGEETTSAAVAETADDVSSAIGVTDRVRIVITDPGDE